MGIPERAKKAVHFMKSIGFASKEVTQVLKKLVAVYDSNYEYIEENSYQVLIDAVLENQELEAAGAKTVVEDDTAPRKRLRNQRDRSPSPSTACSGGPSEPFLKIPKLEAGASAEPQSMVNKGKLSEPDSTQPSFGGDSTDNPSPRPSLGKNTTGNVTLPTSHKEKATEIVPQTSPSSSKPNNATVDQREMRAVTRSQKMSTAHENPDSSSLRHHRHKLPAGESSGNMICYKEPKIEPGIELPAVTVGPHMLTDKDSEDDIPHSPNFEVPIAMICPPDNLNPAGNGGASESLAAKNADKGKGKESSSVTALDNRKTSDIVASQEASSNVDVVSSDTGEVKLKFCFNSDRPHLRMPSLDAVFKLVEERCLKSYKILQPDFSLVKVMKEMCECALELSTERIDDQQENIVKITPVMDSLKRSSALFSAQSSFDELPCSSNGPVNGHSANEDGVNVHKETDKLEKGKINRAAEGANSDSLAVIPQPQIALGDLRPLHDPSDVTKGEERVRISLINDISNEKYPSSFHYIARNIVYQNAYVNFSLARIGDEDCCPDCFGDCVAAAVPCACARETGGDFAYTLDGLVKEVFLDECISMSRDPQDHHHIYCKICPIERSKKEVMPDPCKGHLVRKFIKECWSKCGCNMQCGNRVVQRGITCNLQVFYTPEGKGWGVRTLDELPKGAFVCEYVGEILTNMELYNRTIQSAANAKHTYPVLLDVDWGSEGVLKDEEALCLDATFYGNVARFVNHRCYDANLVEIPVEVETPDHHYYHVAFFTTRKIQAYEELTWDYRIDFDDHGQPVKAFKCRCGSKFCRDMKRSRRSKALIMR